VPVKLQEVMI